MHLKSEDKFDHHLINKNNIAPKQKHLPLKSTTANRIKIEDDILRTLKYKCTFTSHKYQNNLSEMPCKHNRDIFYQSSDGQLYFLDYKAFKDIEDPPLYIYGRIATIRKTEVGRERNPELRHIGRGVEVIIVTLL